MDSTEDTEHLPEGGNSLFWWTTAIPAVVVLLDILVDLVFNLVFSASAPERSAREQLATGERDLAGISMTGEFARYMKLERKLLRLKDEIKATSNKRTTDRIWWRMKVGAVILALQVPVAMRLLWYRWTPLIRFSPAAQEVFYPMGRLLAYPTGLTGVLSHAAWYLICSTTYRQLRIRFTNIIPRASE